MRYGVAGQVRRFAGSRWATAWLATVARSLVKDKEDKGDARIARHTQCQGGTRFSDS